MKTIVFIDETAKIGGAEINLIRILPRLRREGWNPVLLVPEDGPLIGKLTACGISCLIVPGGRFYSISAYIGNRLKAPNPLAWMATVINGARWALALERVITQIQPDIVQTVSMLSHLFGGWAARKAGYPVVSHVQDIVAANSGLGLYHAIFHAWARRVPFHLVCISPLVKSQFGANDCAMRKSMVIWNMVDIEKFYPADTFSKIAGTVEIGTVARLTPWKGQHIALQVARQLKTGGHRFRWQFVGDATLGDKSYAQELYQQVKQWQLEQEVCFLGWQENMSQIYHSLNVLVHFPIEPEPSGLVLAEALSCGLPVITSHSGLDEIVEEAGGLLVPAGDVKAAADAIVNLVKRLRSHPHGADDQQKARTTALKYFSPQTIIPQWLDLYEEVLAA